MVRDGFWRPSHERGARLRGIHQNGAKPAFSRRVPQAKRLGKRLGMAKPPLVHPAGPKRFPKRLAWDTLRQNTWFC